MSASTSRKRGHYASLALLVVIVGWPRRQDRLSSAWPLRRWRRACRQLVRTGVRLENRATGIAKRGRVLPQARHDPGHIRNLVAAQPHHVGRAGHLLLPGSAIFLRLRGTGGNGTDRRHKTQGNTQDNPLRWHGRVLSHQVD